MHTTSVGSLVRTLRKENGWGIRRLAAIAKCSQSLVCRIENGERHPTPTIARNLDHALKGAPSYKPGELIAVAENTRVPGRAALLRRRPWHLPALGSLIGRDRLIGTLDAISTTVGATPIVLTGPASVGKTALAYHLAKRQQHAHPDGVLIAAAHGRQPHQQPRTSRELVDGALADLGIKHDPAADDHERINLLRTMLHRRRMIVIIDDAASADQIRPLLPGADGCTVIVTSRNTLDGLAIDHSAPARYVDVPPLGTPDATRLLRQVVDLARTQADPEALETIAEACEGLPRAILAAGQYLRHRRGHNFAKLARQLTAPGILRRLHVAAGDSPTASLLEAYHASYHYLGPAAQALLQRLADGDVVHIAPQRAAHMLNTRIELAEEILDELAREHLLTPVTDGWVLSKLVAEFAAEGVSLSPADPGLDKGARHRP